MQPEELLQLIREELLKVCDAQHDGPVSGALVMRVGRALNDKLRELSAAYPVQYTVAQWRELGFDVESDDVEAVVPLDALKATLYGDNFADSLRVVLSTYMSFGGPEVLPQLVVEHGAQT